MNLRTLKKLSKRAAPLLPLLGDNREQFRAEAHNNYHGCFIGDRKHWERSRCHPSYDGGFSAYGHGRGREIFFNTRAGRRVVMRPPCHSRKGTMMVGDVSDYYEPEWDEESAWTALYELVWNSSMDIVPTEDGQDVDYVVMRALRSVSDIFQAAGELIEAKASDDAMLRAEWAEREAMRAARREAA